MSESESSPVDETLMCLPRDSDRSIQRSNQTQQICFYLLLLPSRPSQLTNKLVAALHFWPTAMVQGDSDNSHCAHPLHPSSFSLTATQFVTDCAVSGQFRRRYTYNCLSPQSMHLAPTLQLCRKYDSLIRSFPPAPTLLAHHVHNTSRRHQSRKGNQFPNA